MPDQREPTSKNPDGVRFSEIATILEEEGFYTPEVLSPDSTFGQARGLAGRKRTQVMRWLRDLGFVEAHPGNEAIAAKGTVKISCHVVVIAAVPIVYCSVEIQMSVE